jgi:hypothetical protein
MSHPTGRETAEQIDAQEPIPWAEYWAVLRTEHARDVRKARALERDRAREHIVRRVCRERVSKS